MLNAQQRVARAKLAGATGRAARDPQAAAQVEDLRRQFHYLSAEAYIKHVVDLAPPLTAQQRDRLAVLLRGDAA